MLRRVLVSISPKESRWAYYVALVFTALMAYRAVTFGLDGDWIGLSFYTILFVLIGSVPYRLSK